MNQAQAGRLAFSSILAVIGGVGLLGNCGNPDAAILSWLLYTVACGAVLNTKAGERPRALAAMAALPAVIPVATALFVWQIMGADTCFSGVDSSSGRFAVLLLALTVVSWLGVFLFSFAREPLLVTVRRATTGKTESQLRNIESTIRAVASVVAAGAILIQQLI